MTDYPNLESILLKAKIEVMTKSAFISTISFGVRHIISDAVDTAATNGVTVWYNPDFIKDLGVASLAGLLAHECWHIAFQHTFRRGNRDPRLYNIAADYVINIMLKDAGFSLPAGGYVADKYRGWSTEQVYDDLESKHNSEDFNLTMEDLTPPEIAGSEEGSEGSGPSLQDQSRNIIVRAVTQNKLSGGNPGEIPGEIQRIVDTLVNPKMPWQGLLQKFLTERKAVEYSWNRRNRRFKTYLPSMAGYGLAHLTFAIDTSGSVTDEEMLELLSELQGIKDTFNPEKMTIIDCDHRIHSVVEVTSDTKITDLKFTGGGGTSFIPVMDYVREHPTDALIYFTDLYASLDIESPGIPVLWVCNSSHEPAPFGETVYTDSAKDNP